MDGFEASVQRLRSAIEAYRAGSPDDFGRRIYLELLDPIQSDVESLFHLGEMTTDAESQFQRMLDDASPIRSR